MAGQVVPVQRQTHTRRTHSPTKKNGQHNGRSRKPPRRRSRTDRPWYAKETRRHGHRIFGWSFSVLLASPRSQHGAREFLHLALISWAVSAVACIALIMLPDSIAVIGTAALLFIVAMMTWMIGDDDVQVYEVSHTTSQLVCAAATAGFVAMGGTGVVWLLTNPLSSLCIHFFGPMGLVVYLVVAIGLLICLLPLVLRILLWLGRGFLWSRSDLLIYPLIPFFILLLATLGRLSF